MGQLEEDMVGKKQKKKMGEKMFPQPTFSIIMFAPSPVFHLVDIYMYKLLLLFVKWWLVR